MKVDGARQSAEFLGQLRKGATAAALGETLLKWAAGTSGAMRGLLLTYKWRAPRLTR